MKSFGKLTDVHFQPHGPRQFSREAERLKLLRLLKPTTTEIPAPL
jgi:hypothetical protein